MARFRRLVITLSGPLFLGGGLLWLVKAGSILLVGYQPPLIFELAQVLVAGGVIGLYWRYGPASGGLGRAGFYAALLALAARLGASAMTLQPGFVAPAGEAFVFPYSALVLITGVGVFISLILLGLALYRANVITPPWHAAPLAAGLAPLPAALTGLVHIELPILLIGLAWAVLGGLVGQNHSRDG